MQNIKLKYQFLGCICSFKICFVLTISVAKFQIASRLLGMQVKQNTSAWSIFPVVYMCKRLMMINCIISNKLLFSQCFNIHWCLSQEPDKSSSTVLLKSPSTMIFLKQTQISTVLWIQKIVTQRQKPFLTSYSCLSRIHELMELQLWTLTLRLRPSDCVRVVCTRIF